MMPSPTLMSRFKSWREAFLDRHSDAGDWRNRYFSGTTWTQFRVATPLMAEGCVGLVLDAGAGRSGWRETILRTARAYESLDLAPRGKARPDWIGDLTNMPHVPSARFDSVVCHQVLEHVTDPMSAAGELARVLKPGGLAVISVPHLSRRHELPHDYYRFTPEGMTWILQQAGFSIRRCDSYGGLLSFVHHQVSTALLSPVAGIPILGDALAALMVPVTMIVGCVDRVLDPWRLMPVGVVVLAQANESRSPA